MPAAVSRPAKAECLHSRDMDAGCPFDLAPVDLDLALRTRELASSVLGLRALSQGPSANHLDAYVGA